MQCTKVQGWEVVEVPSQSINSFHNHSPITENIQESYYFKADALALGE